MLLYIRRPSGDHAWVDVARGTAIWRGASAWYYENAIGSPRMLCPLDWSDGDALEMYRVKRRFQERSTHGADEGE